MDIDDLYNDDGFNFDTVFNVLRNFLKFDGVLCNGVVCLNGKYNNSVVKHEWPMRHFRSKSCSVLMVKQRIARCLPCRRATLIQKTQMKRKLVETPTRKLKRARLSSKCPITNLTPTTRKKRIRAGSKMRTRYANRAKDLSELLAKKDMTLVDEQSSQMSNIINIVKDDYSEVVNSVINESTIIETERQAMRNIWLTDCAKKRAKDRADFTLKETAVFCILMIK